MPSKIAFLFPGQGRTPEALPQNVDRFAALLDLARSSGILLRDWIESGHTARLTQTDAAQPALLLDSLCRDDLLRRAGWIPGCVAGHSLGEYAALISARVLTPEDAMRAVIERGRLMNNIGGAMAAIVKLGFDEVAGLCSGTEAVIANVNAPGQIVVSGPDEAVHDVVLRAEKAGGRGIPLHVSGPFHSPLMQPAQEALSAVLMELHFAAPDVPVVSSVTGRPESNPEELRALLCRQMTAMVRWTDVSRELERMEIETAVEVGSGDVLTRLGARSGSSMRFVTFEEALNERL